MDLKERVEKSVKLRSEGKNCAQCVFASFSDIYGINEETALTLTASLGSGIAGMREACGAVLGMSLLAGLDKNGSKPESVKLAKSLAQKYIDIYGSIVCGEILGFRPFREEVSEQQRLNCKNNSCTVKIEDAAKIYAEYLKTKE